MGLGFIYKDTKNAQDLRLPSRFLWHQMLNMVFCCAVVIDFMRPNATRRRASYLWCFRDMVMSV
jgi:hypothetical protein